MGRMDTGQAPTVRVRLRAAEHDVRRERSLRRGPSGAADCLGADGG